MRRKRAERRAAAVRAVPLPGWLGPVGLGCLCLLGTAQAQEAPSVPRRIALEPRVSVTETFTDNHNLSSTQAESDAITRLTAGLGWRAQTGLLRGYLDYALTHVLYARHSDRNELQNALNANLSADLLDKRLQFVTSAAIARSAISAFGVQPGGGADGNANTTETRTLQIAPTLRGPLGPELRYTAALGHAITRSANTRLGDSATTNANLHLEPSSQARLGWTLDASHLESDFKQGRASQSDRLFGGLRLNVDDLDLQLTATGGTERTNFISLENTRYNTWGVGAVWAPSPVTRVSAELENRFFGRSHALSIEHRTPRTIFRLRSARSLSTSGNQVAGVRGTAFSLLFDQFASLQPDPVLRELLVNRFLVAQGIDPSRIIDTGFLRSAATLQDLQEFSAAWTGPRNAAVLLLSHSKTRRVDTLSNAVDDLARVDEVRIRNLSLNLSHRLTPLSSLNLLLGVQRSSSGQAGLSSRQTQVDLQFSTRLTPDSTASVSLRRAHYTTGLLPYDETALSATFGVRF
jgi:uncharacterized protein (PEP-CTERM system associated)